MQQVLCLLQQSASRLCPHLSHLACSASLSALIFSFRLHIFIFALHALPRPNAQFLRLLCRHGSWQLAVGRWQVPVCPAAGTNDSQPRAASFLTPVPSQRMGVCVKAFLAVAAAATQYTSYRYSAWRWRAHVCFCALLFCIFVRLFCFCIFLFNTLIFASVSGSLSRSQFPVFTIYAQKSCLGVRPCSKAWCIDRVQGYRLVEHVKSSQTVYSRRDCLELCLGETEFTCR